jgi:hypothetical protein
MTFVLRRLQLGSHWSGAGRFRAGQRLRDSAAGENQDGNQQSQENPHGPEPLSGGARRVKGGVPFHGADRRVSKLRMGLLFHI